MSTAHDHYRDAERLVLAGCMAISPPFEHMRPAELIAAAQVHATLAVAAAHGANRPPVEQLHTRTMSDPPEQGEEITDQMGGAPGTLPGDLESCWHTECVKDRHDDSEPHVDETAREFR